MKRNKVYLHCKALMALGYFEEEAESADYDERESKRHKQDSDWHWKDWKGTASSSNTASASSSQWKSSDWQSGGSWKSESWRR